MASSYPSSLLTFLIASSLSLVDEVVYLVPSKVKSSSNES